MGRLSEDGPKVGQAEGVIKEGGQRVAISLCRQNISRH